MTTILCAGLATVDLVYSVTAIPGADEKAQATGLTIAAGGPATNAAVAAAALGADVILVTAVGAHPLGELVRADLAAHGVRLLDADPDNPAPPPVSAVTVLESTGERTIVSRNAGGRVVRVPEGGLPDADLTLVDGHHPALAVAAARAARHLLVDAGSWRPVFPDIFPHAEVVACSAAFRHPATGSPEDVIPPAQPANAAAPAGPLEGYAMTPAGPLGGDAVAEARLFAADAATARAIGAPHVAVTHGPGPVSWFSGGRSGTVAVPAVGAVDTAGAGDVFHGALAVALAAGQELPVALAAAIRTAAVRVVHPGPRAWIQAL